MRIEMWPQKGGVIGDKVTLMFRLFNTHLFTAHLLCRHLKAGFFSWEKVMSPEKGHNGPVWAFRMCYDGGHSCQRAILRSVSQLLTFYPIVKFFPRFCIAAAAPFYVSLLFLRHCKASPGQLFLHKNMGFHMS